MSVSRSLVVIVAIVAAVAVAIFAVVFAIVGSGESAGPEREVTLSAVLEDPARFEGRRVTVSGEWAENERFSPADAERVIVIGDDAGATLVAIPQLGVRVPAIDDNDVLTVTGEVRVPDRAEAGFLELGGLLADDGDGPEPVIAAVRVSEFEAGRDPTPPLPVDVTVEQLLRSPAAFDERVLRLRGTASEPGERGFALTQDGASIFVSAPRSDLAQVEGGERVTLLAELSRLSRYGAGALEEAVASDPPGSQPPGELDLERLPIEVGEPYLLLRGITGEQAAPP